MRVDPLSGNYLTAALIEKMIGFGFWVGCVTSFAPLYSEDIIVKNSSQVIFVFATVSVCLLGILLRLHLFPKAEEARLADFFGRAYGSAISASTTVGYYNDSEVNPLRKIASQLLENLFFTKKITSKMLSPTRSFAILYFSAWFISFIIRDVKLEYLAVVTQVVFSEEMIAKWIRLEWLKSRTEKLFDETYRAIKISPKSAVFSAIILEKTTIYERVKATASVTLSNKIFHTENKKLSIEFKKIQTDAGLLQ